MEYFNKNTNMLIELIKVRNNTDKSLFFNKMYEAIVIVMKQELIKEKPKELFLAITELIKYFESREEFEKCHMLNQVGMEIYNTIID